MESALWDRWRAVLAPFGTDDATCRVLWSEVATRYGEPQRHHHTLTHLTEVLAALDLLSDTDDVADPADPAAVVLAAFLHDVVYDPTRPDNEAASSAFARQRLPVVGVPATTVAEVARLIEVTANHATDDRDRAGALVLDADLSILGSAPDRYRDYARAVRAEYAHVPDADFRAGRAAVLEDFLGRPRIFHTTRGHDTWDAAARRNLRDEIAALTSGQDRSA